MKLWDIVLRVLVLIIAVGVIGFDYLLYNSFENQKTELSSIKDKQDVEAEFNSNKFKYQSDQIERISKSLEDAQQQIKEEEDALEDQKNSLLQEAEKRQQIENDNKSIQTSLVDIKAEADAIKQDMKGWQKDYVGVLAQLEKGINNIQDQIKGLHDTIDSYDIPDLNQKINSLETQVGQLVRPTVSDTTSTPTASDDKVDNNHLQSQ